MPAKYRLSLAVARLDVEAREAHRGRGDVDEARPPSRAGRSGHSPQVNARIAGARPNDTTSASESSSTPKADVRVGQARDEAVERVEHHRDPDEQRRRVEVAARRVDHAGVAAEQVRDA